MPVVSRFLALPAELRNFIYELAFEGNISMDGKQAGVVMACRQSREEALLLFYNISCFAFKRSSSLSIMLEGPEGRQWLQAIGEANAGQLRYLRFESNYFYKYNKHGEEVDLIYNYLHISVHDDATRTIEWTFDYEDAEGLNIVEEGKPWPHENIARERRVKAMLEQAAGLPDGTYC
ncbi:hypothetical protein LTR56_008777 [Elasticomyces elasticus]|nr:hypothetical protein LTR22_017562 [Elasticomyces elasticus]KAK3646159.1 hypothetical protein LTR56_008777 [Elasticomyces elasticus]KAK4924340.1 hypothetical protein LTR49_008641 [Elasticomyces elasticus]KAK5759102.1 hypothetical protein LTS12_010710 [Elasticomyces elasticus]